MVHWNLVLCLGHIHCIGNSHNLNDFSTTRFSDLKLKKGNFDYFWVKVPNLTHEGTNTNTLDYRFFFPLLDVWYTCIHVWVNL